MSIQAEIEKPLGKYAESVVTQFVEDANVSDLPDHDKLDRVALRFRDIGYFAYRGGNHVALHQTVAGAPLQQRAVLITIKE